jgi:hypothetical protein
MNVELSKPLEDRRRPGRSAQELRQRIDRLKKKWEAEQRRRRPGAETHETPADTPARKKKAADAVVF